ncbi:MAG TPA: DUF1634 domain-containing protein [Candidatus Dormibacteraeota bacterium]|nr:DUF1634 domain-containing protein [Candidatus Dormibacteraeota bacterium]
MASANVAVADPLERAIARVLTVGTYVSVAVLAVGTAMMLASGVQPLSGGPRFDLGQIGDDLVHLRATGFLWLGLVAVVATPASRVVASLVGYLRDGERLMATIAVLILAVIVLSVGLAIGLEG